MTQVHSEFKLFSAKIGPEQPFAALAAEVSSFVDAQGVAPKSIGVEYLEEAEQLLVSLGYSRTEPGYSIELKSVSLGKSEELAKSQGDFSSLEQAMAQAAKGVSNIICHELYVTSEHEFVMVFMSRKA